MTLLTALQTTCDHKFLLHPTENTHIHLVLWCWLLWFWSQDTEIFRAVLDFSVRTRDAHLVQKPVRQYKEYVAQQQNTATTQWDTYFFWNLSSRSWAAWGSFLLQTWNMDQVWMFPKMLRNGMKTFSWTPSILQHQYNRLSSLHAERDEHRWGSCLPSSPLFIGIRDIRVHRLQLRLSYSYWVACIWHQRLLHLEDKSMCLVVYVVVIVTFQHYSATLTSS